MVHTHQYCVSLVASCFDVVYTHAIVVNPNPTDDLSLTARFMFKGIEVPERSLVVRETVGSANADTLMCESDYSDCCANTENFWHRDVDNNGALFPVNTNTYNGWYQTRADGVVRLHWNGGTLEGIFFCQIRVSATELQTLYVGVYPSVTDNKGAGVNGDGKSVWIPSEICGI